MFIIKTQSYNISFCHLNLPAQCISRPPDLLWRCPQSHQSDGWPSHPSRSPEPSYTCEEEEWLHERPDITGHCIVSYLVWYSVDSNTRPTHFVLTHARIDSVTVPIWLTLSSRQLQAFTSTALLMRLGLVTVRSSPTTWMSVLPVKLVQASQSSWSKGSSMETTVS